AFFRGFGHLHNSMRSTGRRVSAELVPSTGGRGKLAPLCSTWWSCKRYDFFWYSLCPLCSNMDNRFRPDGRLFPSRSGLFSEALSEVACYLFWHYDTSYYIH